MSKKSKPKFPVFLIDRKEKINKNEIESLRKYANKFKLKQKDAMIKKAKNGELMSRAPFGYSIKNKKLIPAEHNREVEEIYEEFLNSKISLNKLSKKHNLSVNGLKKVLTNFTYVGKIKFNGEIHEGKHKPIISTILFNHVQNKIEKLGIKRI
ncbi:recombinase family protein [bacterium]|nr:recombinase family protein [bacterium]